METKYPALRRPKRKLCYLTDKEDKPSKQWTGTLKLEDVDKIFDDLDPSTHDEEEDGGLLSSSPLLHISDAETTQGEREAPPVANKEQRMEKVSRCQMAPDGDVLRPVSRSPSPKLDIDLNIPFKAHGPVKTSSPIEKNMVVEGVEELGSETDQVVSPILFDCEDEGKEEAKTEPLPTLKPQCNRDVTEQIDYAELDSPPCNIVLSKPKNHKNEEAGSCKQSHLVEEKAPRRPQITALGEQRKALGQENTVREEPEVAAKNKPDSVHKQPSAETSTRVGKDLTSFLQKLRHVAQPKPACSRKPLSPVKVPTPPEPEDDFLILEDDRPLWFSIPSKTKRQRENRTSSTDKDSSADKAAKDSPLKTAQGKQESEANTKLGGQTVSQKMKKMKGKEKKKNEVTETGNDMADLSSPEDLPAGDLLEQEKPNKRKQRVKKAESKQSDEAEEHPKDTVSRETDEGKPTQKKEKKAQRSTDMKRSKSLKDGTENAKMSRAKSSKGGRKVTQESGAVKETVHAEAAKEQSEKHADAEIPGSLSDQEIVNSEAQTDEKDKQKLPSVSEESSSEDSRIRGKRKRRQTGQWWVSCPQSPEKTKVADIQPTPKKSKQYNREPSAALPSPVKTKKDRVLKRKQTQPAPLSSQNANKAKEKATKRNKNRNKRQDTPSKMKASKVSDVLEEEQVEEQEQQQEDQDLDPLQSSPLVLAYRDHSLNTADQVFQRVYHPVPNHKTALTPASVSPRGSKEQLRAAGPEKRTRKPPNNWWLVNGMPEAVESISSQPQQQKPKPRKERRKLTKQHRSPGLGTPKNGNMAVLFKPPGGTPVPPLKAKPLSSPKTVKRSLATFKDIFTSATGTPAVVSSTEAGRSIRRKAAARPAVGVTVTDCSSPRNAEEDILSIDAGEPDSPLNHETPQDSKCQSENTLKAFRSGPSSMIELEQYEDNDDLILPSSRFHDVLSASDMCAPPLKPLILEPKDKSNLTEWFRNLCSTTVDNGTHISPDQFDWYFYRGRAIGFLVDLNSGSICSGKILLGSFMKKPLQVDHRATTVFHVITSSVSVTIDGSESRFNPIQSFVVPCGHAYSIQNTTAQPAVLCFTRMLAESSD